MRLRCDFVSSKSGLSSASCCSISPDGFPAQVPYTYFPVCSHYPYPAPVYLSCQISLVCPRLFTFRFGTHSQFVVLHQGPHLQLFSPVFDREVQLTRLISHYLPATVSMLEQIVLILPPHWFPDQLITMSFTDTLFQSAPNYNSTSTTLCHSYFPSYSSCYCLLTVSLLNVVLLH